MPHLRSGAPSLRGITTLLVLGLLVAAPTDGLGREHVPEEAVVEFSGPGTWGSDDRPANATWLVIDGTIHAFTVVDTTGTRIACHIVSAPPETAADDASGPPCDATDEGNGTVRLAIQGGEHDPQGVSTPATTRMILAAAPSSAPSPIPGLIVSTLAALFLVAAVILLILYVQERRVAHYLVRRLYEETKGRMPHDWPENLRHQWIARIFIRGKN